MQLLETAGLLLIYAAWNGSTEVVKTLIEIGANINIQNDSGDTSLRLAARRGLTEIAKILVENGADMNIKHSGYGSDCVEDMLQERGAQK